MRCIGVREWIVRFTQYWETCYHMHNIISVASFEEGVMCRGRVCPVSPWQHTFGNLFFVMFSLCVFYFAFFFSLSFWYVCVIPRYFACAKYGSKRIMGVRFVGNPCYSELCAKKVVFVYLICFPKPFFHSVFWNSFLAIKVARKGS